MKGITQITMVAAMGAAFASPALGESISMGGPLRLGHGRPPLHLNAHPEAASTVYYTPSQIRKVYGFSSITNTGVNQVIGIVDAYGNPTLQADLNYFCHYFGMTTNTVQTIGVAATANSSWNLETDLDVEWAHAIAPGAKIILSVAKSTSTTDLLTAVDAVVAAGATVVSMSWGAGEFSNESLYDTHFNVKGVTFVASSGDGGAGVEWPAVSQYVLAVGGTTLKLNSSGGRSSEVAWSGSGGGTSSQVSIPSYQSGWQTTTKRGSPDVSYLADPNTGFMLYYNGGWYVAGGTSAGAPQWAGLIALSNSMRKSGSLGLTNTPNTVVYSTAKSGTSTPYKVNSTYFYDVTSGNDGANSAGAGYDFVTGLGVPVANTLAKQLSTQ